MGYDAKTGVWVLQTSEGDGYHLTAEPILGVFSSHDLAEEYAKSKGLDYYEIDFYELNPEKE